jgi:carbamoyl-phosphate synthase large subunit
MRDINIAITGFGGPTEPPVASSVARALRERWGNHVSIVAVGHHRHAGGAWSPGLVDSAHYCPDLFVASTGLCTRIGELKRVTPFDVLIPCGIDQAHTVASSASALRELGVSILVPPAERLERLTTQSLPSTLHKLDIPRPPSILVHEERDLWWSAEQIGFPLWLKTDRREKTLLHSQAHAAELFDSVCRAHAPVLLERALPGDAFSVALVARHDGSCIGLVALKRIATNSEGQLVCGTVVELPELRRFALEAAKALQWRGPLTLECVRPPWTKDFVVTDIACNLPDWSMLTHWAGCNLPARLVEEAYGRTQNEPGKARVGTMFVRGVGETRTPTQKLDAFALGQPTTPRQPGGDGAMRPAPRRSDGVRVAVTGTSTFDVINPGLGVARALREDPDVSRIYGLSYGTFDSGAYAQGLFDAAFRLPTESGSEPLLDRIREIQSTHPIDVLIPCLDGELRHFIQIAPELSRVGIKTLLPSYAALRRRSKLRLFDGSIKRQWGCFSIPTSAIVDSAQGAEDALAQTGLPAVVKGPISECKKVTDPEQARAAWEYFAALGFRRVIVQPWVAGSFIATASVCDRRHQTLESMTIKKLATCARGSTWGATHAPKPRLEADFAAFLEHIKWVGPAEGEFIRDDQDDRYYLIEVNPRFTAWIYYSTALESSHPTLAVRAALEQPSVAQSGRAHDTVFMRYPSEIPLPPAELASLSVKGELHHG